MYIHIKIQIFTHLYIAASLFEKNIAYVLASECQFRKVDYMSAIECHYRKRCIVRISAKALEKRW